VKRLLPILFALATLAGSAFAADLPPGKWWRRPEIIQSLGLTDDQQTRLDGIFRGSAADLIDLRGAVEKQNIVLRGELDQPQLNRAEIQRAAAKLTEARGRLFERELMMLIDMRGVLTEPQWNRMRSELESRRPQQQQMQQRGPMQQQQRPQRRRP
jgi:Spy/CpxP family protein refolding chaperone